jgi:succinate dehydrogenase / fumarate reductase cytochrome b subunit
MFKPEMWDYSRHRKSMVATLILSIVLWLPAAFWMGRNLLVHNFGLFGG